MFGQLVFLQLSAEFGGTKFGPFPGPEIRLGSDPAASDITLPEALGVLPQHVKILIQGDGSFIVAPTERTAAVHVYRGSGRPKHIATATALAAGDSFALVTAEGPRFIILSEQPKQEKKKPKKRDAKGMAPTKEGMWAEIKRIGFTQVFRSRAGNFFMTFWTRLKSGALFTPRVIIGFLFLSTGWLAAIGAGIAAIGGMFALSSSNDQLTEVQGDLAECEAFEADDDIFTLSARVLGDPEWPSSLRDDDTFHEAFVTAVGNISAKRDDYRWVYTNASSDYTRLKRYAEGDRGLGPEIGKVFAYTAAVPGSLPERDWYMWTDTVLGERGCGRGPSRMTYMQARNLDVPAMPDILVSSANLAGMELSEKRTSLLGVPGMTQDLRELYESQEDEIVDVPVGSAGAFTCSYLEGEDAREEANDLVGSLRNAIGPSARGVPGVDQNYWITSRLIRYYAAGTDVREDYEALSFDGNPPTLALDALPADQQELVVKKAATLAARAATIPCIAALAEGSDAERAADVIGDLPAPTACLLFMFRAGAL